MVGRVRVIVGRIPRRASYDSTLEDGKHFASYDVTRKGEGQRQQKGKTTEELFAID